MLTIVKRIKDRKYLATFEHRTCMCKRDGVECGAQAIPHHLLREGQHGMGYKAGDDKTFPICATHHYELHFGKEFGGNEVAFFADFGWQYDDVKKMVKELYNDYKSGHVY